MNGPVPVPPVEHNVLLLPKRGQVACTACPWFQWMPGATEKQMREAHRRHEQAARER